MVDLDVKDRKILYHLDLNCRQSNTQIGKKVGLSRKVVEYRIKGMEGEGIITGYWAAINTYKLGYYVFRIYINFIDIGAEIKEEIINFFCNEKDVWAVLSTKGPVDFDVIYWVNDIYKFNQKWENIIQQYGIYFSEATVSILTEVTCCKKSYLLNNNIEEDRILYRTNCSGQPVKIDEIDYHLLDLIALNGRMPIIDIANKLHCSSQTVQYRLKQLNKIDVIHAFRVSIDYEKLGLKNCAIDIFLTDYKRKPDILTYIMKNPFVYDIMNHNIGWGDLTFQILINNMDEIFQTMDDLEKKFPSAIRKMNYWLSQELHKERWLPEMTEKDFKKTNG